MSFYTGGGGDTSGGGGGFGSTFLPPSSMSSAGGGGGNSASSGFASQGLTAVSSRDWSMASLMFTLAIGAAPGDAALLLLRANVHLEMGNIDLALADERAFQSLSATESARTVLVAGVVLRARILLLQGRPVEAGERLAEILQPHSPHFPPQQVFEHRERCLQLQGECTNLANNRRAAIDDKAARTQETGFFLHYSHGEMAAFMGLRDLYVKQGVLLCCSCHQQYRIEADQLRVATAPRCEKCSQNHISPTPAAAPIQQQQQHAPQQHLNGHAAAGLHSQHNHSAAAFGSPGAPAPGEQLKSPPSLYAPVPYQQQQQAPTAYQSQFNPYPNQAQSQFVQQPPQVVQQLQSQHQRIQQQLPPQQSHYQQFSQQAGLSTAPYSTYSTPTPAIAPGASIAPPHAASAPAMISSAAPSFAATELASFDDFGESEGMDFEPPADFGQAEFDQASFEQHEFEHVPGAAVFEYVPDQHHAQHDQHDQLDIQQHEYEYDQHAQDEGADELEQLIQQSSLHDEIEGEGEHFEPEHDEEEPEPEEEEEAEEEPTPAVLANKFASVGQPSLAQLVSMGSSKPAAVVAAPLRSSKLTPPPPGLVRGTWDGWTKGRSDLGHVNYVDPKTGAKVKIVAQKDRIKCSPHHLTLGLPVDFKLFEDGSVNKTYAQNVRPAVPMTAAAEAAVPITQPEDALLENFRGIFLGWEGPQWGGMHYRVGAQGEVLSIGLHMNGISKHAKREDFTEGCIVAFKIFSAAGPYAQWAQLESHQREAQQREAAAAAVPAPAPQTEASAPSHGPYKPLLVPSFAFDDVPVTPRDDASAGDFIGLFDRWHMWGYGLLNYRVAGDTEVTVLKFHENAMKGAKSEFEQGCTVHFFFYPERGPYGQRVRITPSKQLVAPTPNPAAAAHHAANPRSTSEQRHAHAQAAAVAAAQQKRIQQAEAQTAEKAQADAQMRKQLEADDQLAAQLALPVATDTPRKMPTAAAMIAASSVVSPPFQTIGRKVRRPSTGEEESATENLLGMFLGWVIPTHGKLDYFTKRGERKQLLFHRTRWTESDVPLTQGCALRFDIFVGKESKPFAQHVRAVADPLPSGLKRKW